MYNRPRQPPHARVATGRMKGAKHRPMLPRKPPAILAALAALLVVAAPAAPARGQQIPDTSFKPPIAAPAYKTGRGPVVLVDEAHNNFHTAYGRYLAFADLLRRDGYRVVPNTSPFTAESLKRARVLVIANAVNAQNVTNWSLPNPSAFTDEEVAAVSEWVRRGGSLFLIVDHMPMPGAAERLGAAFGARWSNGFAVDEKVSGNPLVFRRDDGTLKEHEITRGRRVEERVDAVATFTGSAFKFEGGTPEPLLVLRERVVSLEPQTAWQFTPETKRLPVGGWYQGAVLRHGRGRVALFGEAAMFTAQLAGPNRTPAGMNTPVAAHNPRLLLNVLHWLSGKL